MFDLFDLQPVDYDPFTEVSTAGGKKKRQQTAQAAPGPQPWWMDPTQQFRRPIPQPTPPTPEQSPQQRLNALTPSQEQPDWWRIPPNVREYMQKAPSYAEGEIQQPRAPEDWITPDYPPDPPRGAVQGNALNLWDKWNKVPQDIQSGRAPHAMIAPDPKNKGRGYLFQFMPPQDI